MSPDPSAPAHLALDTSGPVGSVALAVEGHVLARRFLDDRRAHAERVVPAVDAVLEEAGYDRREIAGVVVGAGPGSFTGVRIAAATAKGLARGLACPLWAFSSLAAAALGDAVLPWRAGPWPPSPDLETPSPDEIAGAPRYVLFDARGTRVYAGCWTPVAGELKERMPARATGLEDVLSGEIPEGAVFGGEGALRHRDRIRRAGHRVLPAPAGMPTADGLLRLFAMERDHPLSEVDPSWEPEYLRASSAERERTA
ncbi:MAG: tRNA (adenosine(37)-N6)-threonylcarbamoyltransferase complex dimerization subunit type 1 TsaB [Gemmatimonadota bacterium]